MQWHTNNLGEGELVNRRKHAWLIVNCTVAAYSALTVSVLLLLLQVANRLFDVSIVAADGEVPVWHKDVRFFKVMQVRDHTA